MLYCYAGYIHDNQPHINSLNTYNITSGEWSNVTVLGGDFNFDTREATSRAISTGSSQALGFVTGGRNDVDGMIVFDASDAASPRWQNETNNKPPLTFEGSMEYIRLGPQGTLINFGGYNKEYINPNYTGRSFDRRPMDQINVYDIESATWYNVTASGDVPSDRSAFCTVVSSAPDDSSFQITMYAGSDFFGGHSFADTYVLSIPSFQWINVTETSNLDALISDGTAISGRDHHSCVAYKDRQMLVLGGVLRTGPDEVNLHGCNKDLPAIRALDLSTYKFTSTWTRSPEPYFVPDAVTRIIGGNGQGGATMKQPTGGFNDSALNTNFGHVVQRYTPIAAADASPTDDPSRNPDNNNDDASKSNTGAIAGGVIGGVVALAMAITAIVFLLIRRRKRRDGKLSMAPPYTEHPPARDDRPLEISREAQRPQVVTGEYSESPGTGGYQPLRMQEMDSGWRGNEVPGSDRSAAGNGYGDGDRVRGRFSPMVELPV